MKPILFNTEMVKALLDGRKTVTRRLMKIQPWGECDREKHEIANFFQDEPYADKVLKIILQGESEKETPMNKDKIIQSDPEESKGVEIDQFKNGWIPVEERLPEMSEAYFCTIKRLVDGCIYSRELIWYQESQEWAWWDEPYSRLSDDNHTVLAWMPLPQPYDVLAEKIQVVLDREHKRISGKENKK